MQPNTASTLPALMPAVGYFRQTLAVTDSRAFKPDSAIA